MNRTPYNPLDLSNDVRKLAGTACFAEIASTVRTWDARELEDRLENGALALGENAPDDAMPRLLRGELPSDEAISRLQAAFPGTRITRWRDHGLWMALDPVPSLPRLLLALATLGRSTRSLVMDETPACGMRLRDFDEILIRALEARGDLEAFVALTAIVRHGEASAMAGPQRSAAAATMRMFPRVVGRSPHLFASWPLLVARFTENVWRASLCFEASPAFRSVVDDTIATSEAARRSGIALPPASIIARALKIVAAECSIDSPAEAARMFEETLPIGRG